MVGGAYHPAFRELCEAKRYFALALSQLQKLPRENEYELWVYPSCVSKLVGQHRLNIEQFARLGYRVKVKQSLKIPVGRVTILNGGVAQDVSEIHGITGV